MSVVIAIKDKDKVYVGCDTQVTVGGNKHVLKGESQKVWHYNNLPDVVMGGSGSLRDIQILQTTPDLLDLTHILLGEVKYEYLVQHFFTREYEVLMQKNRIMRDALGNYENIVNCHLILAFEDKMFAIDGEGCVIEGDDYLVIGSGSDIATGILETNKSKKPEIRIKEAIEACADNTIYVNNTIYITSTEIEKEVEQEENNSNVKPKSSKSKKVDKDKE